jgi:DnaJ family protein C protein 7
MKKKGQSTPAPAPTPMSVEKPVVTETPKEEPKIDVELAEKHKNDGNTKLNAKQYSEAIDCYTKAIEFNPKNHIYYANRHVLEILTKLEQLP